MRIATFIAAALSLCLGGCGTVMNLSDLPTKDHRTIPAANRIYGGVESDAVAAWHSLGDPSLVLFGAYMSFIDLPASFVADTATLPITVPATLSGEQQAVNRKLIERLEE